MPTVASVLDEAARKCRVTPPGNWVSSTTDTAYDFKDILAETADELLERIDWPNPINKDTVISGTGAETYDLPSDFKRLTRDQFAVYETTTTRRVGIPVNSNGDWTHIKTVGIAGSDRYYRVTGDEESGFDISFYREPAAGNSITVSYVSRNWLSVSGTGESTWTDVSAVLLLPKYLVIKGVVWRFRKAKGLPYLDTLNEYEADLSRRANDTRGIRKIGFGPKEPMSPLDIPVPNFIPPAS